MSAPSVALETQNLRIREFDTEQAEAIAKYYQRNLAHFQSSSPPRSSEFHSTAAWMERLRQARDRESPSAIRFAVYRKAEPNAVVGHVELSEIARGAFMSCYMGYGIDAEFQGRGIMFEAVSAVTSYAFRSLRLHRIQANYMPTNVRSGALLRRLGFQQEGFARDYLFLGGGWQDHVMTALLNPEPLTPPL